MPLFIFLVKLMYIKDKNFSVKKPIILLVEDTDTDNIFMQDSYQYMIIS